MIELTKEELESLELIPNYVLIKGNRLEDEMIISDDFKLKIDKEFNPGQNSLQSGYVIKTCSHILFEEKYYPDGLEFDTNVEVEVGDRIIFHHNATYNAKNHGRVYLCNGEVYYGIKYDTIFVTIRNEEIIPVNGYVLVEAVKEELKVPDWVELPESIKNRKSGIYGKVKYIGNPVKGYKDDKDWKDDSVNVSKGDIIIFTTDSDRTLEYHLHGTLENSENLYRMQRVDILAIHQ